MIMQMKKKCFLFEGQGTQFPGMGRDIYQSFEAAKEVFALGSQVTGIDLVKLCHETKEEELNRTNNAQLAVFTVSMAIFSVLEKEFSIPDFYAGFSLGECSALCAAGVVSIEDGFEIIKKRGEVMQNCALSQKGAMYAIIGLDDEIVEEICADAKGYVTAANYNCPMQLVIAGDEDSAEKAANECIKKGAARAVRLPVSGAFHTKHMQQAAQQFYEYLKGVKFSKPKGIVYSNVYQGEINDFSVMPEYLAKHIISPVRWKMEIGRIIEASSPVFYELGCSKTLSGFNRKIDKNAVTYNLSAAGAIKGLIGGEK